MSNTDKQLPEIKPLDITSIGADSEYIVSSIGLEDYYLEGYEDGRYEEDSDFQKHNHKRIVRCKDCKWSRVHDGKTYPGIDAKGKRYCILWGDGMTGEWVPDDGYCHKGMVVK